MNSQRFTNTLAIAAVGGLMMLACKTGSEKTTSSASEALVITSSAAGNFPSYCPIFPVPAGTKDTFSLSQAYPDTFDVNAAEPWMEVDFRTDYQKYMKTVLSYAMEGNLEVDFNVQKNAVRQWYSAPWMHDDGKRPAEKGQNSGRECLHGLTREITIPVGTLAAAQTVPYQTYAIAFYNQPGGYTIGKVWKNPDKPAVKQSTFPEGTVAFKLLFTEADTTQVPYLANSKKWTANIFYPYNAYAERVNKDVRLLQLDIAIKDERATETSGWVYGTFIYDASQSGSSWVDRMVPVGLMWGDDSGDSTMLNISNKYNPSLKQTVINQSLLTVPPAGSNKAYVTHLGMGGRMNGPVDNPISSCISCHARAAISDEGVPASIANFGAKKYTYQDFQTYFSTIPCGVTTITQKDSKGNETTFTTGDYSFQLVNGIRNFMALLPPPAAKQGMLRAAKRKPIPMVSRDGSVDLD